jgi:hypothetical protein
MMQEYVPGAPSAASRTQGCPIFNLPTTTWCADPGEETPIARAVVKASMDNQTFIDTSSRLIN